MLSDYKKSFFVIVLKMRNEVLKMFLIRHDDYSYELNAIDKDRKLS